MNLRVTEKESQIINQKNIKISKMVKMNIFCFCVFMSIISLDQLVKNKQMRYDFLISNTDRSEQPGTRWWSTLGIHPRNTVFLFYSFRILGLKNVIVSADTKINNKTLLGQEKFKM